MVMSALDMIFAPAVSIRIACSAIEVAVIEIAPKADTELRVINRPYFPEVLPVALMVIAPPELGSLVVLPADIDPTPLTVSR